MANATVSRIGAINGAVANKTEIEALFLKVFSGEVLAAFERENIMLDKSQVRTIASGKSAQFPAIGRIAAAYHTAGAEIVGQVVNHAERVITIDGLLISHAFIADIDEAMSHFEVRSVYTTEMGRKLAITMDNNIMREVVLAARAAATLSDLVGGTSLTDANFGSPTKATQAQALFDGLANAAQAMDEKDVPKEDRYAAFKPAEFYALASAIQSNGFSLANRDYGGMADMARGTISDVFGFTVLKTNNLPITDLSGETYHAVDCQYVKGIAWQKAAVGTVKLMDLSIQSEWDIRRQGTLMVARYAVGHGILRPECAVEFKTQ